MKDSYLITGGAGFIGINLADHYLGHNKRVTLFDNLSRRQTWENIKWLMERHEDRVKIVNGDVRQSDKTLSQLVDEVDVVYKVSGGEYTQDLELGIIWDDQDIGVCWPLESPFLSEKDAALPPLREADHNFVYQGSHQ